MQQKAKKTLPWFWPVLAFQLRSDFAQVMEVGVLVNTSVLIYGTSCSIAPARSEEDQWKTVMKRKWGTTTVFANFRFISQDSGFALVTKLNYSLGFERLDIWYAQFFSFNKKKKEIAKQKTTVKKEVGNFALVLACFQLVGRDSTFALWKLRYSSRRAFWHMRRPILQFWLYRRNSDDHHWKAAQV